MAHYIDKDALVAEINKRIIDAPINYIGHQRVWAYNDVKDIIDTLEVKEVDLDKELCDYFKGWEPNYYSETEELLNNDGNQVDIDDVKEIAKHFFELGLKANNPVTSADRGTAEEIIINLKMIESDYKVCLTKEIEWVRKQVGQPDLKQNKNNYGDKRPFTQVMLSAKKSV